MKKFGSSRLLLRLELLAIAEEIILCGQLDNKDR